MNKPVLIEDGTYGFAGAWPLIVPDVSELEEGTHVRDNNGNGLHLYVCECCDCHEKFLMPARWHNILPCYDCENKREMLIEELRLAIKKENLNLRDIVAIRKG